MLSAGNQMGEAAYRMQESENADMLFRAETALKDDYLKFAEDMMSAAKQLKILVTKRDYAGARGCFDKVKKSCDGCHEGYR